MNIFLDNMVIDYLFRITVQQYNSPHKLSLEEIRSLAEKGRVRCFMALITRVEMLHGLEKAGLPAPKVLECARNDSSKLRIAEQMNIVWVSYPASRGDDTYSRSDLTLRSWGPQWNIAHALEEKLLRIQGISNGDARQIVSMLYGVDQFGAKCDFNAFVTEDGPLLTAIKREVVRGSLSELDGVHFCNAREFIDTFAESNT